MHLARLRLSVTRRCLVSKVLIPNRSADGGPWSAQRFSRVTKVSYKRKLLIGGDGGSRVADEGLEINMLDINTAISTSNTFKLKKCIGSYLLYN